MGDRLGIPRVVDSFLFVLKIIFWSVIFNLSILSKRLLKLFRPKQQFINEIRALFMLFETKCNLLKYRPSRKMSFHFIKQPAPRLSSGQVTKKKCAICLHFFQVTLERIYLLPKSKWQEIDYFEVSAYLRLRPYHMENTGSRLITEVKPCRARSVLGWVTAQEYLVQQTLFYSF